MTKAAAALAPFTLDDLNGSTEASFEFEYALPNGEPSGVWLSVYGSQSPKVAAELERLTEEIRKKEAMAQARAQRSGRNDAPAMVSIRETREYVKRMTAIRLAGWRGPADTEGLDQEQKRRFRGLADPFNAENAYRLVNSNDHVSSEVLKESDDLGHFMKASRETS